MRIGTIVSSRSHVALICQVDKPLEAAPPPGRTEITFGRFVRVGESAVGLLYDSQLLNPDFGHHAPRVAGPAQAGGAPSGPIDEPATLMSVLLLGSMAAGTGRQDVPQSVAPLHAEVRLLDEAEIRSFHQDPVAGVQVRYVPMVLSHAGPMAAPLLMGVLDRLAGLFPEDRPRIEVLRKTLHWQSTMGAL